MTFDEQLDVLEELLRKLKIQYDLFFLGVRKIPPTFERAKLDAMVHEMSRVRLRDISTRFRFNTILGRYNQFRELWSRRGRERDEGPLDYRRRTAVLAQDTSTESKQAEGPSVTSRPAETYVRVTESIQGEALSALHAEVTRAQNELGKGNAPTIEQLSSMVSRQVESLRGRYGVVSVDFRVETVDGKVKLKAKPIRDKQP
ncbi:MAG TPA: MXAN_5187 C-terminal domain-containing protein [Thermoanaerobaculia bacterium]|nr:MXAN_5187 C-terminal domain-containing protein [Thermoanaerobaculia bacterium]